MTKKSSNSPCHQSALKSDQLVFADAERTNASPPPRGEGRTEEGREGDFPHRNVTFVWQAARVVSHCRSRILISLPQRLSSLSHEVSQSQDQLFNTSDSSFHLLGTQAIHVNGKTTPLIPCAMWACRSHANEHHCVLIRMTKVDLTFGTFQGACTRLR